MHETSIHPEELEKTVFRYLAREARRRSEAETTSETKDYGKHTNEGLGLGLWLRQTLCRHRS